MPLELKNFMEQTCGSHLYCWDTTQLNTIATTEPPDLMMRPWKKILKADIHIIWAKWFLESVFDPEYFLANNEEPERFKIFRITYQIISKYFSEDPNDEVIKLCSYITDLILAEAQKRFERKRKTITKQDKIDLWSKNYKDPRCYICGYRFSEWAIKKFLKGNDNKAPLPQYLDFYKPIGLKPRDIQIEIEHVIPIASTGGSDIDNLRLACGWCNSRKGARNCLYDQDSQASRFNHPIVGDVSIPKGFWIVRVLSLRQRCEFGGCDKNVKNSELTVAPLRQYGSMNPVNLKVICKHHDPLKAHRKVRRSFF